MLERQLKSLIRKGGFKLSEWFGSRIRGWGNSSEGFSFTEVYPWRKRYTRNGYFVWGYISARTQDIRISYHGATHMGAKPLEEGVEENQMKALYKYLVENKVSCKWEPRAYAGSKRPEILVVVDNPYSEEEVKRSEDRWKFVSQQRKK